MQRIIEQIKLQAAMVGNSSVRTRMGTVSSYDPDGYCCKVVIQPEGTETGWLPIATPWCGNGWGLMVPVSVGDEVDVHFDDGDLGAGFVSSRFFNDVDRPLHAESGVFYLIHKSGSALKFNNDGSVDVAVSADLRATVGGNATIHVTGKTAWTSDGTIEHDGGTGSPKGVVQGDCMCSYTGKPHPHISGTVKGSK